MDNNNETFNFEHQKDALMMMAATMEDAAIALRAAAQNISNLQKEFEKMSNDVLVLTHENKSLKELFY